MTPEEIAKIEKGLFVLKKNIPEEKEEPEKNSIITVAIVKEGSFFMWWNDYLGAEIEVFENKEKLYFTTTEDYLNNGFVKKCNIPKKYCFF